MQISFSSYKILFNVLCVSFNVVNTAEISDVNNNSDTRQQKPVTNTDDGVFKIPNAVKNKPIRKTTDHEYLSNTSSNNTEYSDSQLDNVLDSTLSPIPIEKESKSKDIRASDSISEHDSKFCEKQITSIGGPIQSINLPEQTDNTNYNKTIDQSIAKKDIEAKKVTDNNISNIQEINKNESRYQKTSKSISNNSTDVLKYLNNKSLETNISRNFCYDMFIDEYIEMISEPHIYNILPDWIPEDKKIGKPIFPLFFIVPHTVVDDTSYFIKESDFTFTRNSESKNMKMQSKKIEGDSSFITSVQHIQTTERDDHNYQNIKLKKILSKKRKLTPNDTYFEISGEGTDQPVIKKRSEIIKETKEFFDMLSNISTDVSNEYDFSENNVTTTYKKKLSKPKLKRGRKRIKPDVIDETNPSISNTNTSETNINNYLNHTFTLNGQDIQHNFKLPKSSSLVLENINGKIQKTKYVRTIFRKYNNQTDTYRMNFYIPTTSLNKLEIQTLTNIKSIIFHVVSSEYKLQQHMHISIYGLKNNDNTLQRVFTKKFLIQQLDMLLTNLLNAKFPIYMFQNVEVNGIIRFVYHTPEKDMELMSISEYINKFQQIKDLLRTKISMEVKNPNLVVTKLLYSYKSNANCLFSWFLAISAIKENCIAFIESIEDIRRTLQNSLLIDNASRIHVIKNILKSIISRINPNLYCFKIPDTCDQIYLYETMAISFQMFLQNEIKGVFEYWIQYIAETDEMLEIYPILIK